jgi:hypothetical protein
MQFLCLKSHAKPLAWGISQKSLSEKFLPTISTHYMLPVGPGIEK